MQFSSLRLRHILAVLLIVPLSMTAAGEKDTVAETSKKGIIGRLIHYFDQSNKRELTTRPNFTPLGGPHYSSEKGFGLGLVVAGDYSTCPSDTTLPASNISLKCDLATKRYYSIGLDGVHVFPSNSRRINYSLKFQSFATYFWGIGYEWDHNNDNKTQYNLFDISFTGDFEWRFIKDLYFGPAVEISYINAYNIADYSPWQGEETRYIATSAGARLQYDTRDNLTYPHTGVLFEMIQLFSPRFLGNGGRSFSSSEVGFNVYKSIWSGGILAARLHGKWTYGHTPWGKLPFLGGGSMRAYYEGRYRDRCSTDLTVELRQHVYRRSGIVVWGSMGTIYHRLSDIKFKSLLPDAGIGYRWEFKKNSNVRIDIGFGKHSSGFMFGLNESF